MIKRVNIIDGLRGFSLIGILIANMLIFQYGMFGKDKLENFHLFAGDHVAYVWIKIFVESSFIPIFMFLFGYSMIKLKEKLEQNNEKIKRHFVRRFFLLMFFGLLHSLFVWEGDILLAYGLSGFLMLLFLNRKKQTMLVWTIILLVLTSLLGYGELQQTAAELKTQDNYIQKESTIYANGDYSEVFEFRASDEDPFGFPDYMYLIMFLLAPLTMMPMFLLGMYAAKSAWFTQPKLERGLYIRYASLFIPIGLFLKTFPYIFDLPAWEGVALGIGAPFLSIGYIFMFAIFYTKENRSILQLFENVGRLSMTNYLLQSIICTTIFYGYGMGLFGKAGVLKGLILALFIYGFQVIFSHYYLKLFKTGPFEKLIRIGTYWSWKAAPRQKVKPIVANIRQSLNKSRKMEVDIMYSSIQAPQQRLSKDSIKVSLIGETIGSFFWFTILGVLFYLDFRFSWREWIGWILMSMMIFSVAGTAWSFIHPFLVYRNFRYDVNEEFLQIKMGAINEEHRLIPMTKIQSVSTKQGPLLRKYGLAQVSIETFSSSHTIPVLTHDHSIELRNQIAHFAKIKEVEE